nr:MAG TPA: hypothetical protein [Caudoviricetes sp.]
MTATPGSPTANRHLFFLTDTPAPTRRPRSGYLPRAIQKKREEGKTL